MSLKNALNHFTSLAAEAGKKSELKVCEEFIQIINNLRDKDLSVAEIQTIETALDELNFHSDSTNRKKNYRKALKQFKAFLKDSFSFTTKGYFTALGIAFGSSFGIIIGIVILSGFERTLGISLGIAFGTAIGLIIGNRLDAEARASGKMV